MPEIPPSCKSSSEDASYFISSLFQYSPLSPLPRDGVGIKRHGITPLRLRAFHSPAGFVSHGALLAVRCLDAASYLPLWLVCFGALLCSPFCLTDLSTTAVPPRVYLLDDIFCLVRLTPTDSRRSFAPSFLLQRGLRR